MYKATATTQQRACGQRLKRQQAKTARYTGRRQNTARLLSSVHREDGLGTVPTPLHTPQGNKRKLECSARNWGGAGRSPSQMQNSWRDSQAYGQHQLLPFPPQTAFPICHVSHLQPTKTYDFTSNELTELCPSHEVCPRKIWLNLAASKAKNIIKQEQPVRWEAQTPDREHICCHIHLCAHTKGAPTDSSGWGISRNSLKSSQRIWGPEETGLQVTVPRNCLEKTRSICPCSYTLPSLGYLEAQVSTWTNFSSEPTRAEPSFSRSWRDMRPSFPTVLTLSISLMSLSTPHVLLIFLSETQCFIKNFILHFVQKWLSIA